jgi:hypothetical protein
VIDGNAVEGVASTHPVLALADRLEASQRLTRGAALFGRKATRHGTGLYWSRPR